MIFKSKIWCVSLFVLGLTAVIQAEVVLAEVESTGANNPLYVIVNTLSEPLRVEIDDVKGVLNSGECLLIENKEPKEIKFTNSVIGYHYYCTYSDDVPIFGVRFCPKDIGTYRLVPNFGGNLRFEMMRFLPSLSLCEGVKIMRYSGGAEK